MVRMGKPDQENKQANQSQDAERRSPPRWFRYTAIGLIALGIFFRFYNLDRKAYWIDETHTSLRMTGHTKAELVQELYTGAVISQDDLQKFQRLSPDKGWDDTFNALKGNAEHTPLYFLLARVWSQMFGTSVAAMRSLTAILSVLVLPAVFWLCRELFGGTTAGWMAMVLFALSPLHVLYAQEARPYSLWTLLIVLASAALLWGIRTQKSIAWVTYGATVALGLYTQLLFGLVVMAHGLYMTIREFTIGKGRFGTTFRNYLLSTIGGIAVFIPWVVVVLTNLGQVQDSTASLTESHTFPYMLDRWFLNAALALVDQELGTGNLVLVGLSGFAVYYLLRRTPLKTGLLIGLLVFVPFLVLALPDLALGGERSTRIRYLFPSFVGVQIALTYLFTTQAVWVRTWQQRSWRVVLIALLFCSLMACGFSSQAQVWWSKSNPRSGYFPGVSATVNSWENPLIISDGLPPDLLAISYWLDPDVKFQLTENPRTLKVAQNFSSIFLLNPSRRLRTVLIKQGYTIKLIYADRVDSDDEVEYRLWWVIPPKQTMG